MRSDPKVLAASVTVGLVVLAAVVSGVVVGGGNDAGRQANGEYVVETTSGEQFCVSPIEGSENVSQFYGYNTGAADSRGGETGLEEVGVASVLLYRDTTTDELSLVFLHGSSDADALRRADYDLDGFDGASWRVKDDPESYAYDTYLFDGDAITGVKWRWQSGTDGGAIGPLGEEFSVSVDATTHEVETWRVVDGDRSVAGTIPVGGSVEISSADSGGPCASNNETTEEMTETTETTKEMTETTDATTETTTGENGPGFGVVVAVLAVFAAVGLRYWRR